MGKSVTTVGIKCKFSLKGLMPEPIRKRVVLFLPNIKRNLHNGHPLESKTKFLPARSGGAKFKILLKGYQYEQKENALVPESVPRAIKMQHQHQGFARVRRFL